MNSGRNSMDAVHSERPLVSIVMPAHNSEKYIGEAIDSVIAQTYQNWELLVCDDNSSDSSQSIISGYASRDARIRKIFRHVNGGAAQTRNDCLNAATGELIAFLDSDDYWSSKKLETQVGYFLADDSLSLCCSAYSCVDEKSEVTGKLVDITTPVDFDYEDLLRKNVTMGCLTVMFRRSSFDDFMMPDIRTGQDYALWLKLIRSCKRGYKINTPLAFYRITSGSISRNKVKKARRQWQIYRELENLSLVKSMICFCFYARNAVFRK